MRKSPYPLIRPQTLMLLHATVTMRPTFHDPTPRACPFTTMQPDANGWVPPGTCGYISRPYCEHMDELHVIGR